MNIKEEIIFAVSENIKQVLNKLPEETFDICEEFRIRAERPLSVKVRGRYFYITKRGGVTERPEEGFCPDMRDISSTMEILSGYSLYAFSEEIRKGFVTINGGHRVGISGSAVTSKGEVIDIRRITSLNIRVSHQIYGCADGIFPVVKGKNAIIISPPGCGKTTLLRDLIRLLSNSGINISVVDERSEIGGGFNGTARNDCGINTDILDGCPKQKGMEMMLRSMGPQYIAVDEIGGEEDSRIIEEIINCGVNVICTAHGRTEKDVLERKAMKFLAEKKAFDIYIFLHGVGQIKNITDSNFNPLKRG